MKKMDPLGIVATIILSIVGVLLIIITIHFFAVGRPLFVIEDSGTPAETDPVKLERVRTLGRLVLTYMNETRMTYALISGGLLGLVRHDGDMIPWDDDIDIAVAKGDAERYAQTIVTALAAKGYSVRWNTHHCATQIIMDDVFVDIFEVEPGSRDGKPVLEFADANARLFFPGEYFAADMLSSPLKASFIGMIVPIPRDYMAYLDRTYPGWLTNSCPRGEHTNLFIHIWRTACVSRCYRFSPEAVAASVSRNITRLN